MKILFEKVKEHALQYMKPKLSGRGFGKNSIKI